MKRERSEEEDREELVERRHKRKERERSEGRDGFVDDSEDNKRARVLDERKRFDERRVKEELDENYTGELERSTEGSVNPSEVKIKKEELDDNDYRIHNIQGVTSTQNGGAPVSNVSFLLTFSVLYSCVFDNCVCLILNL